MLCLLNIVKPNGNYLTFIIIFKKYQLIKYIFKDKLYNLRDDINKIDEMIYFIFFPLFTIFICLCDFNSFNLDIFSFAYEFYRQRSYFVIC